MRYEKTPRDFVIQPVQLLGLRSEVRVTTLRNGFRIATVTMPGVESASVRLLVDTGSRHESRREGGMAHMLEHMVFKGTKSRSAREIVAAIENAGGDLNAYTNREHTCYYARVLGEDVGLAIGVIADMVQNSTFDPPEITVERGVILEEIRRSSDDPGALAHDGMQALAFPDQPLGRPILGTKRSVRRHRRRHLVWHLRRNYCGTRMVLAVAGAVDHDEVVQRAQAAFASLAAGEKQVVEPANYVGGDFRMRKVFEQAHLVLSFEGVSDAHPDYFVAQAFADALGGGMTSRLFQEAREKRGLCYSIGAGSTTYFDTGLISIYAGASERKLSDLASVIINEIDAMASLANEEEAARARRQIRAELLMSLESPRSRASRLAYQLMIFGRPVSVEDLVAQVEAVDASALRRFAQKLMARGRPTVSAVGPIRRLPSYASIRAKFG